MKSFMLTICIAALCGFGVGGPAHASADNSASGFLAELMAGKSRSCKTTFIADDPTDPDGAGRCILERCGRAVTYESVCSESTCDSLCNRQLPVCALWDPAPVVLRVICVPDDSLSAPASW